MKITVSSTDQIVDMGSIRARIWEGTTEEGSVPIAAFIINVAAHTEQDAAALGDLMEVPHPAARSPIAVDLINELRQIAEHKVSVKALADSQVPTAVALLERLAATVPRGTTSFTLLAAVTMLMREALIAGIGRRGDYRTLLAVAVAMLDQQPPTPGETSMIKQVLAS